jgi:hypothetical protein
VVFLVLLGDAEVDVGEAEALGGWCLGMSAVEYFAKSVPRARVFRSA